MDFNLRIQKDEYGNKVVKFNLSHTERITLPYETAKSLNKQLSCALAEPSNDASALPIPDVRLPYPLSSSLDIWQIAREMNSSEFRQYYDGLINGMQS